MRSAQCTLDDDRRLAINDSVPTCECVMCMHKRCRWSKISRLRLGDWFGFNCLLLSVMMCHLFASKSDCKKIAKNSYNSWYIQRIFRLESGKLNNEYLVITYFDNSITQNHSATIQPKFRHYSKSHTIFDHLISYEERLRVCVSSPRVIIYLLFVYILQSFFTARMSARVLFAYFYDWNYELQPDMHMALILNSSNRWRFFPTENRYMCLCNCWWFFSNSGNGFHHLWLRAKTCWNCCCTFFSGGEKQKWVWRMQIKRIHISFVYKLNWFAWILLSTETFFRWKHLKAL